MNLGSIPIWGKEILLGKIRRWVPPFNTWMECLNIRFPLSNLMCAGYSLKLFFLKNPVLQYSFFIPFPLRLRPWSELDVNITKSWHNDYKNKTKKINCIEYCAIKLKDWNLFKYLKYLLKIYFLQLYKSVTTEGRSLQ